MFKEKSACFRVGRLCFTQERGFELGLEKWVGLQLTEQEGWAYSSKTGLKTLEDYYE